MNELQTQHVHRTPVNQADPLPGPRAERAEESVSVRVCQSICWKGVCVCALCVLGEGLVEGLEGSKHPGLVQCRTFSAHLPFCQLFNSELSSQETQLL